MSFPGLIITHSSPTRRICSELGGLITTIFLILVSSLLSITSEFARLADRYGIYSGAYGGGCGGGGGGYATAGGMSEISMFPFLDASRMWRRRKCVELSLILSTCSLTSHSGPDRRRQ